jgi:hypothetical protein
MAEWVTSAVTKAGPAVENSNINVQLRALEGQFAGPRWYVAAAPVKKEMLATALTAITTGLHVNAFLEGLTEYETLLRLYVSRED